MRGKVLEFEGFRGLGVVADAGGRRYPFHCTRIADGTRDIPVGSAVEFEIEAGLPGQWEATNVRRITH